MDNSERISLGVAIAAHAALFAVLSYGLVPRTPEPRREAVSVTLAEDVGLTATARDRPAPAASAAPPALSEYVPPILQPSPQPSVSPSPQPSASRTPEPAERVRPRRTETRREAAGSVDRRDRRRPDRQERPNRMAGITEGISPTNDTGTSSSQASVSSSDQANLISRITNAIRPCYNLGSLSGTAAEDIVVRLRIQPSRDGSLSSRQVSVLGAQGVNGSNREYQRQMVEAARSAVLNPRCPLPSLPANMYENGWSDVVLRFIPAQLT